MNQKVLGLEFYEIYRVAIALNLQFSQKDRVKALSEIHLSRYALQNSLEY